MNKILIIGFVGLFASSSLFADTKRQVKYTREMLKHDAAIAALEFDENAKVYESLPEEKRHKIECPLPMAIYGKKNINSKDSEYLILASGNGKSTDLETARTLASKDCASKLITQFIYKNEEIKKLTQGSKKLQVQMIVNVTDVKEYVNLRRKISSGSYSKEIDGSNEETFLYNYTCAVPLKPYISIKSGIAASPEDLNPDLAVINY